MIRALSFYLLSFICLVTVQAYAAGGLTLYSYEDDHGQVIVVDSIERIPHRYRDQVEKGFVPSFRGNKASSAKKAVKTHVSGVTNRSNSSKSTSDISVSKYGSLKILAPPDENDMADIGLATATLVMKDIRDIVQNHTRILVIVREYGFQHVSVNHLYLTNGQMILNLKLPDEMSTDIGKEWIRQVGMLIKDFKETQLNALRWINAKDRASFVNGLPILINNVKVKVAALEKNYEKMLSFAEEGNSKEE